MRFYKYAGVVVPILIVLSGTARAEQEIDPKALAKAQFMLRQMSSERDALQGENARLKTEREALKAKKTSTDGALSKSRENLRTMQENLDKTLAEKKEAEAIVAERGRQIEQCTIKNTKLYQLNGELLKRYADKGMMDAMARREPFTGFKKVEMENLLQEMQDKLDEQRVLTDAAAPSPAAVTGAIRAKKEGSGSSPQAETNGTAEAGADRK